MRAAISTIEILLAIVIMGVIFAAVTSVSIQTVRRKSVEGATDRVASLLNQAKANAQSSKSAAGCTTHTGWEVVVTSSSITIRGLCVGLASPYSSQTYTLPSGVSASTSPTSTFRFNALGRGTNLPGNTTITISNSALSQSVIVTPDGEIR